MDAFLKTLGWYLMSTVVWTSQEYGIMCFPCWLLRHILLYIEKQIYLCLLILEVSALRIPDNTFDLQLVA